MGEEASEGARSNGGEGAEGLEREGGGGKAEEAGRWSHMSSLLPFVLPVALSLAAIPIARGRARGLSDPSP